MLENITKTYRFDDYLNYQDNSDLKYGLFQRRINSDAACKWIKR